VAVLLGDWGTSSLRAWVIGPDGDVLAFRRFPLGVGALGPGEAAARFEDDVRPALEARGMPALLSGMIGSNLGWAAAGYVDCPISLDVIAKSLTSAAPGVRIVPGLRCAGLAGPDVMRGEETQLVGWLVGEPARGSGRRLVCLPGTHAKWVRMVDGRVEGFITAMTGELYALLNAHGTLRFSHGPGDAAVNDAEAFDQGLEAAGDGGALAARLFSVRGRIVAGELAPNGSAAYLSGLLIGAEVAGLHPLMGAWTDAPVDLVGDAALCAWYARAFDKRGVATRFADGEAVALAGLREIWRLAG